MQLDFTKLCAQSPSRTKDTSLYQHPLPYNPSPACHKKDPNHNNHTPTTLPRAATHRHTQKNTHTMYLSPDHPTHSMLMLSQAQLP